MRSHDNSPRMAFLRASLLIAVLLLWQLAALAGLPEFVLSPLEIVRHFVHALGIASSTTTSRRASRARCPASRSARARRGARLAAGTSRWFDRTLSPAVFLTYPVPKIVMLPIFMLWFGIGDLSKVLIIALACFYPVFINAYYGAKGADDPRLVGAEHGRRARRDLPARGRAERRADDLRRHAGLARAFLHRHVRRRDDQRALRARPHDPRGGELAALRPDVRLAPRDRDPRLCRRPPGALAHRRLLAWHEQPA